MKHEEIANRSLQIETLIEQKLQEIFNDCTLHFDKSHFAGGLTNYNYIMTINNQAYVIREPGKLTELMIDRVTEQVNNHIASQLNVNSKCFYFDPQTGMKISFFIPDSKNLAQNNPVCLESLTSVVTVLHKLHQSPVSFQNTFDWRTELGKYETIITADLHGSLFFDYENIKNLLYTFLEEQVQPEAFVNCHNDTVPENFLVDTYGQTYLIDWEYSGLNDPNWDLAAYMLETRLPVEAIDEFLNLYYPQGYSRQQLQNIKAYMMIQDLLWTIWALIRHYCGDNFLEYCDMRYNRLRKNIENLTINPYYTLSEMVQVEG